MDQRWKGRVALVTGASGGIGATVATLLARSGMNVVGAARRVEKVEELAKSLEGEGGGSLMGVRCDLSKDDDVYNLFKVIEEKFGRLDVCVNNAAVSHTHSLLDGSPDEWRTEAAVNVVAPCLCSKLSVALMRAKGVHDGHIINISSLMAHSVLNLDYLHFYAATKHAARAISQGLRQELKDIKSGIRVSDISPGIVTTEFLSHAFGSDFADSVYSRGTPLRPEDVAAAVVHVLSAPQRVEVNDMIITPTDYPS